MKQILVIKEQIIRFYQKAGMFITPVLKFCVALFVFLTINMQIGYDTRFASPSVALLLSLICAFTPSSVLMFFAAVISVIHVYRISLVLSIMVGVVFLILYLLFLRFSRKYGYAALAIPILYPVNLSYFVPLYLGMTGNPLSLVSAICGILIYYMFGVIKEVAQMSFTNSVEDILALYRYVVDSLLKNKTMLLTIIIFSLVIIVTYVLRKMKYDHSFSIAIASGTLVMILGFLFANIKIEVGESIGRVMLGCLVGAGMTMVVQFFRLTLDYTAVEQTQFEDDDYYYYVKAVPKLKIAVPEKSVRKIVTPAEPSVEDGDPTGNLSGVSHMTQAAGKNKPASMEPSGVRQSVPMSSVSKKYTPVHAGTEENGIKAEEFDIDHLESFSDEEFEPIDLENRNFDSYRRSKRS